MNRYRLGKRPARKGSVQFRFASYFKLDSLPKPPEHAFGRYWRIEPNAWGMLANDRVSCCVYSGAAHETELWLNERRKWDEPKETDLASFTDDCVLKSYSEETGYDPSDPNTDQGADMSDAAAYRRVHGILDSQGNRHKIAAYVELDVTNLDQLKTAAWLFGAIGLGFQLPDTAEDQFDNAVPWSVSPKDQIDGGHYTPLVGMHPSGNLVVVTWGRTQLVTPEYIAKYADEGVAYLTTERMNALSQKSPDGFDYAALQSDLNALSTKSEHVPLP